MKKKSRLQRSDVVWGLAAAALVLMQFWWLPGEKGTTSDSYSNTIDGKLGLYRTLSELFPNVSRENLQLVPDTEESILLMVAPDRYPTKAEEEELYAFVYYGGQLLFAPNWSASECRLPSLGIEIDSRFFTSSRNVSPGSPAPTSGSPNDGQVPVELRTDESASELVTEPRGEPSHAGPGSGNADNAADLPAEMPVAEQGSNAAEVPPSENQNSLPVNSDRVNSAEMNSGEDSEVSSASAGSTTAGEPGNTSKSMNELLNKSRRSNTGLQPPPGDVSMSPSDDDLISDETKPVSEVNASSVLTPGTTGWRSSGKLVLPQHRANEALVSSDEGVEVAYWPLGSGGVMVSSSPDVFSNRSLLFSDSRRLSVRMVEYLEQQAEPSGSNSVPIVINEFLNASDSYRQTGVLFSPALRIGTLQLIMLAVLGLWFGFHRFGPAEISRSQHRRSLTDSAKATGNLLYRLNDGGAVVGGYLEYITSQLRRRFGNAVRLDQYETLASRAGLPVDEVQQQLKEAEAIAMSPSVSAARTAASLRWLAELQNRLAGQDKRRE